MTIDSNDYIGNGSPRGKGDTTNITGAVVPAGAVNGDYLMVEGGNLAVASAREDEDSVDFSKSVEVPPGTIFIGPSTGLSASIRAIAIRSDITGNNALLLAQLFDATTGFSDAFTYRGTPSTIALNDPPGTNISDTAVFSITTTADELLTRVDIPTGTPNTPLDFAVTARADSHSGPVAIDFTGTITTDATGIAVVDLLSGGGLTPILVDSGFELFYDITCAGMVGKDTMGVFVPNALVHRIVVTRVPVPKGIHGGGHSVAGVATLCAVAGTHYKVDAVFVPWPARDVSWDGGNNRFVFTGDSGNIRFDIDYSAKVGPTGATVEYRLCKNGVPIPGILRPVEFQNANTLRTPSMSGIVPAVEGDYFDLCVSALSSNITATTTHIQVTIG